MNAKILYMGYKLKAQFIHMFNVFVLEKVANKDVTCNL